MQRLRIRFAAFLARRSLFGASAVNTQHDIKHMGCLATGSFGYLFLKKCLSLLCHAHLDDETKWLWPCVQGSTGPLLLVKPEATVFLQLCGIQQDFHHSCRYSASASANQHRGLAALQVF